MPRWAVALALVIILAGLFLSYRGFRPGVSDKDQVLNLIGDVELAANQRDWGRVLNHVSADYHDKSGMNKDSLRGLALQAGGGLDAFRVQTRVPAITVSDRNRASALVQVKVAHGQGETEQYAVTVVFEKRKKFLWLRDWVVVEADGWQGAVGGAE
jgi:hypothetical protein